MKDGGKVCEREKIVLFLGIFSLHDQLVKEDKEDIKCVRLRSPNFYLMKKNNIAGIATGFFVAVRVLKMYA